MKKLGLAVLVGMFLGLVGSVLAEPRSDMVKMTNGTMTISMDDQFSPPKILESVWLLYSSSVTNGCLAKYRARGVVDITLYSGTFTNSVQLMTPTGIVVSATDSIIITNSMSNGWIVLNYKSE